MAYSVMVGDCRDVLKTIPDCSIDAVVCDPPYELGFMGKKWDKTGIAYDLAVWNECLRVLKPGGHIIAFGGSRTYHRLAVAIEEAGFEIRDQIQWLYGSGFPKSLDISKAMDKKAGAARTEVIGTRHRNVKPYDDDNGWNTNNTTGEHQYTAPATDLAKQWQGWGTALKPAHEPAVLARKPFDGSIAGNVAQWGTGGLNIDGTRVAADDSEWVRAPGNVEDTFFTGKKQIFNSGSTAGRWPANVIIDETAGALVDEQSGYTVSSSTPRKNNDYKSFSKGYETAHTTYGHNDTGGASRFFYTAKSSKEEREAGLHYMNVKPAAELVGRVDGSAGMNSPGAGAGRTSARANNHPTVKPVDLMRYLIRLITPPGGVVLDPFCGSGSTGCGAVVENMDFIGIDITPEYADIARRRIGWYAGEFPALDWGE